MNDRWHRYWAWCGVGYGLVQAGVAAVIVASGLLMLTVPLAWLAFGPDLGVGFPWR